MNKRELRRYHALRIKKQCFDIVKSWRDDKYDYCKWNLSREIVYLLTDEERYDFLKEWDAQSYILACRIANAKAHCSCSMCKYPKGTPHLQDLRFIDESNDNQEPTDELI